MSAGEVQLAALGMQDVHLTGSPQVTYFKGVYRRHTPFSVQSFNIPFQDRTITWGNQGICRIPYKGDMIQSMTLAVTLPPLFPYSTQYKWPAPAQTFTPQPYLYLNGQGPYSTAIGITTFFTVNTTSSTLWLDNSQLKNKVFYSPSGNKFNFDPSVTSVSIRTADAPTAVFWGLDPHGFTRVETLSDGNQVYTWTLGTSLTILQAGWVPYAPSATTNSTNSLLFTGGASVASGFLNFGSFGSVLGASIYMSVSAGGNLQFKYKGSYALLIEPVGLPGNVTGVSVSHGSSDSATKLKTDYFYSFAVQFSGQTPRVLLPFYVSDPTQYYFLSFQGVSSGALSPQSEVSLMDLNEFWTLTGTTAVNKSNVDFSNGWTRRNFTQNVLTSVQQNTFSFFNQGLYNIYGELTAPSTNTITSVGLWSNDMNKLVTQWNTPQAASPTLTFSLPVQVSNPATNNYSLVMNSQVSNLVANSMIGIEYFGTSNTVTTQENDFRQNGLLTQMKGTTNYSLGTNPVNFSTMVNAFGATSRHIHVTPGGNINFSNSANYRISTYFETSNAYVSNVSILTATNDGDTWAPVYTQTLPLGISGGYVVDVIVDATTNFSNVFQVQVGLAGSVSGQTTTNVTSNAYFTFLGVSSNALITNYSYVDSVGTYLIESAELKIGGQSVETLTGEYIEMYNDLFVSQENQPGLTLLTGKLDSSPIYTIPGFAGRTYYINLPFFFYANAELSLPICALDLQDLEVYVNFKDFQMLLSQPGIVSTPTTVTTSMIVDYAYLSDPEVRWFSSHRQDYIIRQIQYETFSLGGSLSFDMNFLGPVRELYFVIQDASAGPYVYTTDQSMGLTLTLNGEDYVDSSTLEYQFMRFVAPLHGYARQPDRVLHIVPLCRHPQDPRPSGSLNMSRIYQKKFQVDLPTMPSLATKTLRLVATSYNVLRVENGLAGIMFQ
jgi:hypothetical protein